jgi:hypothetical protein
MGGACSTYGENRDVFRALVVKPEGNRPLRSPRRRCNDNIKLNLQKVGCRFMDWIKPAQDRDRWRALGNALMNFRVA